MPIQSTFGDTPDAVLVEHFVSPDGDKIARAVLQNYSLTGDDGWAIEIASLSGGTTHATARLVWPESRDRTWILARSLAWSADSRYLFFLGTLEDGGSEHLMRLSVEDGSLLSFPAISDLGRWSGGLSVSADGRHISVVTGEKRLEIWRMTFNDSGG